MQIQRITSEWLRGQGLPVEHIRDFELKWPSGLDLTEANLLKLERGLTCDWLASQILSGPAEEAYQRAVAAAYEAYEKAAARRRGSPRKGHSGCQGSLREEG